MILVTGAAGLIGSAVVRELNARGKSNLLLADHLGTSDKWLNLRSLSFADYFEKDDLLKQIREHRSRFKKVKQIIHLGACSSTTEKDVSYLIENNYKYSQTLAELAHDLGARFVYASSAATYGDGEEGFVDSEKHMSTLRPLNPYGYSKHIFDQWMHKEGFLSKSAALKYFNVFGPNEYHKGDMQSVVLKAFHQISKDGKLNLFKSYKSEYRDGEQMRDFLYVKDAARITVFLTLDSKSSGLFNVGSGQASTWLQLVGPVFKAMGKETNIQFVDMPEHMREKYQYYTCAPIDRLGKSGYSGSITPLEDAVTDYVKNYLVVGEKRA